jgi:hypothetical protein
MSAKAQSAVLEARKVADFLDSIGEHKRANDVRQVCRSNDGYRQTLAKLHKDNMALKAREETGKHASSHLTSDSWFRSG